MQAQLPRSRAQLVALCSGFAPVGEDSALSTRLKVPCLAVMPAGCAVGGLAIATAAIGAFALDQAGLIEASSSFYISNPTTLLATIVGGLMFGLGMAFVGTCGYGCLARIGGGDLKSVVTFLVMGISAYATLRGATAYLRIAAFPQPEAVETPASFAHAASNLLGTGVASNGLYHRAHSDRNLPCFCALSRPAKENSHWRPGRTGHRVGLVRNRLFGRRRLRPLSAGKLYFFRSTR